MARHNRDRVVTMSKHETVETLKEFFDAHPELLGAIKDKDDKEDD